MNYDAILKKVNPTYLSAKGCLGLLAKAGYPEMMSFYNALDKETLPEFGDDLVTKSRIISLELRHTIWKIMVTETYYQTIVELPCGYLPHSLTAAKLKKNYYGLDLPIVIHEVSQIAARHLSDTEKSFVQYHGVDATNYDSLRNALNDVQGKILIMTDGFLGYFDDNDVKVVCDNIHRLLNEFGGCWYTTDSHFMDLMGVTYAELNDGNMGVILEKTNQDVRRLSEDYNERLFNEGTLEERKRFIENCGFSVKSFFYTDKVKVIPSLKDNPALMQRLLSAYKGFMVWILTAEATDATEKKKLDIPFVQEFSLKNDILSIRISGRLDTITAPKLLQKYEEERAKYTFKEIHVNAAELEFISYAGLRMLKIMRDSLEDKSLFKIYNANSEVENILKGNGF